METGICSIWDTPQSAYQQNTPTKTNIEKNTRKHGALEIILYIFPLQSGDFLVSPLIFWGAKKYIVFFPLAFVDSWSSKFRCLSSSAFLASSAAAASLAFRWISSFFFFPWPETQVNGTLLLIKCAPRNSMIVDISSFCSWKKLMIYPKIAPISVHQTRQNLKQNLHSNCRQKTHLLPPCLFS